MDEERLRAVCEMLRRHGTADDLARLYDAAGHHVYAWARTKTTASLPHDGQR